MNQKLQAEYVEFVRKLAEDGLPFTVDEACEEYRRDIREAIVMHAKLLASGYGK